MEISGVGREAAQAQPTTNTAAAPSAPAPAENSTSTQQSQSVTQGSCITSAGDTPLSQEMQNLIGLALAMAILEMLSGQKEEDNGIGNALALAMMAGGGSSGSSQTTFYFSQTIQESSVAATPETVQNTYTQSDPQPPESNFEAQA
jgi:hypothetical protein